MKNLNFEFSETFPEKKLNILKGLNPSKAVGIDNLSGKFLKDSAEILARPISQLCNPSTKLSSFAISYKIVIVKPFFKKGSKTDPKNYHPILLLPILFKLLKGLFKAKYKSF